MYLLYLDESGNPDDASDQNFVLAGAAIFDRVTHFVSGALDDVQTKHFPGHAPIDFHATQMRSGQGFWRNVEKDKRTEILQDISSAIAGAQHRGVVLFASVVRKSSAVYGEDAVKRATEDITKRFDSYLKRRYREDNDPQRGLLIFAEGRFHERARLWVKDFRALGTQWGTISNLSDIPYFASAKETRLLQVADFVAHAVFLLYERNDPHLIKPILGRFDRQGGEIRGLTHLFAPVPCGCPACLDKQLRSKHPQNPANPWI